MLKNFRIWLRFRRYSYRKLEWLTDCPFKSYQRCKNNFACRVGMIFLKFENRNICFEPQHKNVLAHFGYSIAIIMIKQCQNFRETVSSNWRKKSLKFRNNIFSGLRGVNILAELGSAVSITPQSLTPRCQWQGEIVCTWECISKLETICENSSANE